MREVCILQKSQGITGTSEEKDQQLFFFLKDIDYVNVQKFLQKSLELCETASTKLQSHSTIIKELLGLSVQKHNYNTQNWKMTRDFMNYFDVLICSSD